MKKQKRKSEKRKVKLGFSEAPRYLVLYLILRGLMISSKKALKFWLSYSKKHFSCPVNYQISILNEVIYFKLMSNMFKWNWFY